MAARHKRKRSGERLTISAADWNSFLDSAEQVLGGKQRYQSFSNLDPRDCHDIIAYNSTGSNLSQFQIVGLDTINATPSGDLIEFKQQRHIWQVVEPAFPQHLGRYGICQVAIPTGECGVIRVAGVTICQVSGTEPDGAYLWFAEMEDGNYDSLNLCHRGSAQVLFRDSGTDWSIVRIGNGYRPTTINATLQDGADFEDPTAADPHDASDIEGVDLIWSGPSNVSVYNPLRIKLWQFCRITAHYNVTQERWEVTNATANRVVHGIQRTDECKFEKLDGEDGWHSWDENSEAEWVTSIYEVDCQIMYDTNCNTSKPVAFLDFVKEIVWDYQTCSMVINYNCPALHDSIHIDLDFVKDITYVHDSPNCGLLIKKCNIGPPYWVQLPFVEWVEISGNVMYQIICDYNFAIATLGPCDTTPPACGANNFIAHYNANGVLEWYLVGADACVSPCTIQAPPDAPIADGQTATVDCE